MPDWVRRVAVARRGKGGTVTHAVGGAQVIVALAQFNCVTPHVWTARADAPDRPDRLVFDLDPPDADERSHFPAIRAGALELGEVLRELGLVPFAMTSGSRGIHVVAPLRRRAHADEARATAGTIAERVAERRPDELTTAWRKEKRGGRVLVDVARNTYAQTTVAPVRRARDPGGAGRDAARLGRARGRRPAPAALDARERPRTARGARLPVARARRRRAGAAAALERDPHVPEVGEEAPVDGRAQVGHAGRAAGPGPRADLARRHQGVVVAPARDPLVVVHQQLGDLVPGGPQRVGVVAVELGERRHARVAILRQLQPGAERLVERRARRRLCRSPGQVSRAPDSHSIARNWRDWKPDAGASGSRNARNPSGLIVSSTSSWSSSSRSTATVRRRHGAAACGRPAASASRAAASSCRISLNQSS